MVEFSFPSLQDDGTVIIQQQQLQISLMLMKQHCHLMEDVAGDPGWNSMMLPSHSHTGEHSKPSLTITLITGSLAADKATPPTSNFQQRGEKPAMRLLVLIF